MEVHVRLLAIALVAGIVSGCANQPTNFHSGSQVPGDRVFFHDTTGTSTLQVSRDSGYIGMAIPITFYIDGVALATFRQGETAEFKVPAGEHIIGVTGAGNTPAERPLVTKPGSTTRLRITAVMTGIDVMPTAF